ncbi:MAG: SAM-dependent methyltransferase [Leadbetterella sp.]
MGEWFESWFDSPYYHILYKSRSDSEAKDFIEKLCAFLELDPTGIYCDLACGKGRHAKHLNSKGFHVIGLDLSPNSIAYAKQFENETLQFYEHDIRNVYKNEYFDGVFNLFTSFGYFETHDENAEALKAIAASIKSGGIMVLDYMNSKVAIENFQEFYKKTVNHIDFRIDKKISQGFIFKNIQFEDKGQVYTFSERVKILYKEDFEAYFEGAGLEIINVFGSYELDNYELNSSSRLIMICKKTS